MPDYTVKADVDTMLRANDKAGIRSAIGVGTTDAPTFLSVSVSSGSTLSGNSGDIQLSSTSGIRMFPTTGGTHNANLRFVYSDRQPRLNSYNGSSLRQSVMFDVLGDLAFENQISGIVSVQKVLGSASSSYLTLSCTSATQPFIGFSQNASSGATAAELALISTGVLGQRNARLAQALRVYNDFPATTADEWAEFDWKTTLNTLRIGTQHGGTGQARPIEFVTGGVAKWQISAAGHLMSAGVTDNLYDIGASGANRPRDLYIGRDFYLGSDRSISFGTRSAITSAANGQMRLSNNAGNDFSILQLGGLIDAFPAIARDGAGIKITGAATGLTSWIKVPPVAVASLPIAATAGVGARSFVNDALTPVFGSAVTGGGAVTVPVYSTGSAWNVG